MTKLERKELLLIMLDANEKMSEKNPSAISTYASSLVELSNSKEIGHAKAIWRYEMERENLDYASESYYGHILNLEEPDKESRILLGVMEGLEKLANSLFDASEEGYHYFLEIDSRINKIPAVEP